MDVRSCLVDECVEIQLESLQVPPGGGHRDISSRRSAAWTHARGTVGLRSMLWPTEPRTTVCGVEQVLQLQYRVRWLSDDVSVRNDAAPVTVQLAGFSCSLSGETLIAEPSSDCSSVDAARAALELALHAWEASSELNQGLRFSFEYTGSAVHAVASSQPAARCRDRQCGRI